MGFYGTKMTVPGMRPWAYIERAAYAPCDICSWVYLAGDPKRPFALKFINRMCPMHGHKLPRGYI